MGLFEAAILWGFALTIAIYVTASISTAHLNPAVTCALAVIRSKDFSLQYAGAYILSQLTGSFCAALVNFWIFLPHLRKYEGKSRSRLGLALHWSVGFPIDRPPKSKPIHPATAPTNTKQQPSTGSSAAPSAA